MCANAQLTRVCSQRGHHAAHSHDVGQGARHAHAVQGSDRVSSTAFLLHLTAKTCTRRAVALSCQQHVRKTLRTRFDRFSGSASTARMDTQSHLDTPGNWRVYSLSLSHTHTRTHARTHARTTNKEVAAPCVATCSKLAASVGVSIVSSHTACLCSWLLFDQSILLAQSRRHGQRHAQKKMARGWGE